MVHLGSQAKWDPQPNWPQDQIQDESQIEQDQNWARSKLNKITVEQDQSSVQGQNQFWGQIEAEVTVELI